jgi:S1-C subfamily serine protease
VTLEARCAACGFENRSNARFCATCGTLLAEGTTAEAPTEPERQGSAPVSSQKPSNADSGNSRRSLSPAVVAVTVAGVVAVAALAVTAIVVLKNGHTATRSNTASTVVSSTTSRAPSTTVAPPTFAQLFASDSSGVIRIETTFCGGAGVGSGFLIAPDLIVTAAHVVSGAASITLRTPTSNTTGQVVGIDESADVALVKAQSTFAGHAFALADQPASVGTPVAAIGFPEGLPITFTEGTISALDRTVPIDGIERSHLVQTDTAINPGNSGGPLLTTDGDVVGIVDAGSDAHGLSWAVSPTVAKPFIDQWETSPQSIALVACGVPGGPDVQVAVGLVQQWATALASGDWVTARQLDPAIAGQSDATLSAGYGGLKGDVIEYVAGTPQDLGVASVAYEDVGAGSRTNIYCYTINVDTQANTLTVVAQHRATPSAIPGWVEPTTLSGPINTCTPSA